MQPCLILAEAVTIDELEQHFPGAVFSIWEKAWVVAASV